MLDTEYPYAWATYPYARTAYPYARHRMPICSNRTPACSWSAAAIAAKPQQAPDAEMIGCEPWRKTAAGKDGRGSVDEEDDDDDVGDDDNDDDK